MTKKRKRPAKTKVRRRQAKKNPGVLKKVTKTTGWLPASAVKFKRNKGKIEVYIRRKPRTKKATRRKR